jgi:hypothetical protein
MRRFFLFNLFQVARRQSAVAVFDFDPPEEEF